MLEIKRVTAETLHMLAVLALKLWPNNTEAELAEEFQAVMAQENAVLLLAYDGEEAIGFAQSQLRYDYVEGTHSAPVGYLEGIYVAEDWRKKGVAKQLLTVCENWSREKGCIEFASDCELDNTQSLGFHLNVGFREANRIICFTKEL